MTKGAYFEVKLLRDDGSPILIMTCRASDSLRWSAGNTPIIFGEAGDNMALFGFELTPDIHRLSNPDITSEL